MVTGYRVSVGEPEASPLAVSEELGVAQRRKFVIALHGFITLLTVGLWLPVCIIVALFAKSRAQAAMKDYSVRIVDGQLFVGTRERNSMFPLERIQALSTSDGVVTVTLHGQAQGIRIEGLVDPLAASSAILRARDEKTRVSVGGASSRDGHEHELAAGGDARRRAE